MAVQGPSTSSDASQEPLPKGAPDRPPERPWRTEGLPKDEPPNSRRRWITAAIWGVGYLLLFGMFTIQDRLAGPQPITYTEFKLQVSNKNVGEVFARGD